MPAKYYLICLLLLWHVPAKAQTPEKLDSAGSQHHGLTLYGHYTGFDAGAQYNTNMDTGFRMLVDDDPTYMYNLGSIGLPAVPIFFQPQPASGFQWGFHQWDAYRYTRYNVRYYDTQNPYTDLNYLQGGGDLQAIKGVHTQNIKPNWNFGVNFRKMDSKGFYTNQRTVYNQVGVTTHYTSLSQRYQVLGSFIYNGFQMQENGGISDLNYFNNANSTAQQRASVWLNTATQRWREVDYNVSQYLYFGKSQTFKVSDTADSVRYILPRYFLSHNFNVHRTSYIYGSGSDEALYFPTAYYTPNGTQDSLWQRRISNEVSMGVTGPAYRDSLSPLSSGIIFPWKARLFGRYEYEQFRQQWQDTIVGNAIAGAEVEINKPVNINLKAEYYLSGYNQGDYKVSAMASSKRQFDTSQHQLPLFSGLTLNSFEPDYIWQKAYMNHFRWDNHWQKSQLLDLFIGSLFNGKTHFGKSRISLGYTRYGNALYLDSVLKPQQTSVAQQGLYVAGNTSGRFGVLNYDLNLRLQKMIRGDVFKIPTFYGKASFFFQRSIFQNAMLGRIGVDVGYYSSWQAPGYSPEISAFAVQDTFSTGNYPVLDFWVAAKVKSFHLFVKIEHLNQGFPAKTLFISPYYPIQPRTWRVGVKWTFYN